MGNPTRKRLSACEEESRFQRLFIIRLESWGAALEAGMSARLWR